ncbi:MAG: hypothetical protein C7B43_00130 [Sulfobacillus benefaciens]|uniref:Uncharacterized protein n=1 Tax=Sulfobacillus benefaciens TaxID=453960 RepID=A0A2T2XB00_9FIRM|nr:MAG: hypothetical protein C7B43_00130 [Sulfobacillus benefaciens]
MLFGKHVPEGRRAILFTPLGSAHPHTNCRLPNRGLHGSRAGFVEPRSPLLKFVWLKWKFFLSKKQDFVDRQQIIFKEIELQPRIYKNHQRFPKIVCLFLFFGI